MIDTRRMVLSVALSACVAHTLAGQSPPMPGAPKPTVMTPADFKATPSRPADHRLTYGTDANQVGDLRLPARRGPHPVVVLIHGGCWMADYATLRDLAPIGDALKADGVASWNVEYRRLRQPGSGWPGTYLDIGRAIDHLRQLAASHNLDLNRVVVLGHSAGGHLAMWAASRHRMSAASPLHMQDPLPIRGVINLAGTIDMRENIAHMEVACRDTVVTSMLGGTPKTVPERYASATSTTMLPLGIPQILIWGEHEDFVPRPLAQRHVDAALNAGDRARLIIVPAIGHFESASPLTSSWPTVLEAIRSLLAK